MKKFFFDIVALALSLIATIIPTIIVVGATMLTLSITDIVQGPIGTRGDAVLIVIIIVLVLIELPFVAPKIHRFIHRRYCESDES